MQEAYNTGTKKNWEHNLLSNLLKQKALNRIADYNMEHAEQPYYTEQEDEFVDDLDDYEFASKDKMYENYSSRASASIAFDSQLPISIICYAQQSFGISIEKQLILPIAIDHYVGLINGAHYHKWAFPGVDTPAVLLRNVLVDHYALLLPRFAITKNNDHRGQYTLIESNWKEIQENGSIALPHIQLCET